MTNSPSLEVRLVIMKSGEELIAYMGKKTKTHLEIHYPYSLETRLIAQDSTENKQEYATLYRKWPINSDDEHLTLPVDMFYMIINPSKEIVKKYMEIVESVVRCDERYLEFEMGMQAIRNKSQGSNTSTEESVSEIRKPTQSEFEIVMSYLESLGLTVVDETDIISSDDDDDDDDDYDDDDGLDSDQIEGYDDSDEGGWNPHDRWSR